MADNEQELDVLRDMLGQSDSIDRLLQARGAFEGAYKAFREEDFKAFQAVLKKTDLLIHCHRVCHWIRTKECGFLCLHLAGPPVAFDRAPDPRVLAAAIAKLGADERLTKHVADILVRRDRDGFAEILKKLDIVPHAHLFCHWLCTIRYRLVCHWVCHGGRKPPVLWEEIRAASLAIGELAEDKRAFRAAVTASTAGDAEKLGAAIRGTKLFARCHFVCEFFCSWRCVMVCLSLCRPFTFIETAEAVQIKEAREFAAVCVKLAQDPADLLALSAAVGTGSVDLWTSLLKRLKLERFCFQLCHWVCGWRCTRFCRLVCIDIFYNPWFTHVGDFGIVADIDPLTGLTNKVQNGHGGPDFAFFGNMSLRGFCPKRDPAHPAEAMAYRFLFQPAGAAMPTPITGGFVSEVLVGTRYALWNGNPELQSVRIRGTGATSPTPPTPGPGLTPPDHFVVPDAEGWVPVDPQALDDAFSGYLMGFASGVGIPVGATTTTALAGSAVPVGEQKNGTDCAIIFQATRLSTISAVNGGGIPDYSNSLGKARINNWAEVALLDLLQFHTGGATACSPLSNALDIEYTVDHEFIRSWSIGMSTASGMVLTSPPPPPQTTRGGAGTHHENTSTWPTCSYAITLTTQRRLTNGLDDDDGNTQQKTFCIGKRGN
jgi:hypothetical protein